MADRGPRGFPGADGPQGPQGEQGPAGLDGADGRGNPYASGWQAIPDDAKVNDVLLRALGIGAGLLQTVNFVEMSYR